MIYIYLHKKDLKKDIRILIIILILIFILKWMQLILYIILLKQMFLLLGFSCLSHIAGIYNKNTVYYIDYHMPKILNSWININEL